MSGRRIAALGLLAVLLTGCGQQNLAGLTRAEAAFDPATGRPTHVRIDSGKEYDSLTVTLDPVTGAVTWTAREVRAFEAHRIRAAVQAAAIGIAPEMVDAITGNILHLLTGGL